MMFRHKYFTSEYEIIISIMYFAHVENKYQTVSEELMFVNRQEEFI